MCVRACARVRVCFVCMREVGDQIVISCLFCLLQLLGMILSMCLCKTVQQEDYTKVPKYWEQRPLQWLSVTASAHQQNNWNKTDQTPSGHTHIHFFHFIIPFKHWNITLFGINSFRLLYLFVLKKLVLYRWIFFLFVLCRVWIALYIWSLTLA